MKPLISMRKVVQVGNVVVPVVVTVHQEMQPCQVQHMILVKTLEKLTPDVQESTLASRNRLHDLPESFEGTMQENRTFFSHHQTRQQ